MSIPDIAGILAIITVLLVLEPLTGYAGSIRSHRTLPSDLMVFGALLVLQAVLSRFNTALPSAVAIQHPLIGAIAYALSFTFLGYWMHRAWHLPVPWALHRFHHSAVAMNPLVGRRLHPIEVTLDIMPFALLGLLLVPPLSVIAVMSLHYVHEALIHSNLPWTWGWFGRWVISAPANHRLHHSPALEHTDKNFGIFPVWDHLFGTWCEPTASLIPVGIRDTVPAGAFAEVVADGLLFLRGIRVIAIPSALARTRS